MPSTDEPSSPAQEDLLAKNDAHFVAGFDKLYEHTWGEGAIPASTRSSPASRCPAHGGERRRPDAGIDRGDAHRASGRRLGTIPTVRAGYRVVKELGLL